MMSSGSQRNHRLKILTVGDGDFTLSLALIRAYGTEQIDLVASTLVPTKEELLQTYHTNVSSVVAELQDQWNIPILYGIDATQLHTYSEFQRSAEKPFDIVMFHHPHLGLTTAREQEAWHAERHFRLLAHYFWSARQIAERVHVCLCGLQPQTWRLEQAAQRAGLANRVSFSTVVPPSQWWNHDRDDAQSPRPPFSLVELPPPPNAAAPRKYRNGKLGSKHFLGKYGYQHRRTHGDELHEGDIRVDGSKHYIFTSEKPTNEGGVGVGGGSGERVDIGDKKIDQGASLSSDNQMSTKNYVCSVCGSELDSRAAFEAHWKAPALPDPPAAASVSKDVSRVASLLPKEQHLVNQSAPQPGPEATPAEPGEKTEERGNEKTGNVDNHDDDCEEDGDNRKVGDYDDVEVEFVVTPNMDGKRLRWCLRQPTSLSKKQCDDRIKNGQVRINSKVVLESSRILRINDKVALVRETRQAQFQQLQQSTTTVPVHFQSNDTVVVFKPVGMRTMGSFSPNTLESIVSAQVLGGQTTQQRYQSLSRLDTGCAGLCLLRRITSAATPTTAATSTAPKPGASSLAGTIRIRRTLTALVHGRAPDEWTAGVDLAIESVARRWNQPKTSLIRPTEPSEQSTQGSKRTLDEMLQQDDNGEHATASLPSPPILRIRRTETATLGGGGGVRLSTVEIVVVDASVCVSDVCFVLRQNGHGVVNDRYGKDESYLTLPRSMRNLIKRRLAIGCYKIEWDDHDDDDTKTKCCAVTVPERLSVRHWQIRHKNNEKINDN